MSTHPDRKDLKIVTETFPMLDTGIGQEMGYEDDKAFLEAQRKRRAALSPEVRQAIEDYERELQRRVLFGDNA